MSQDQRDQMIRNIHNETLRLSTLTSSFLDLARLESGRVQFLLTKFHLGPLLEECQQIMQSKAEAEKVAININIPPGFPTVEADRDKLKQVVFNLLSNAIKYNRPNGSVTITAITNDRDWTLSVSDTGMGIPEKDLAHLFQKFYRVQASEGKVAGTGLGLSICKQIVSGHGGSIEVESKLGVGTLFIIHLPKGN